MKLLSSNKKNMVFYLKLLWSSKFVLYLFCVSLCIVTCLLHLLVSFLQFSPTEAFPLPARYDLSVRGDGPKITWNLETGAAPNN